MSSSTLSPAAPPLERRLRLLQTARRALIFAAAISCFLCPVLTGRAAAQCVSPVFAEAPGYAVGLAPNAGAAGEFNGDGIPDPVVSFLSRESYNPPAGRLESCQAGPPEDYESYRTNCARTR